MSTLTHSVEAMKEEAPENHSGHSTFGEHGAFYGSTVKEAA